MSQPLPVVLDSNVVLSALLFRSDSANRLRQAWQGGLFQPLASSETIVELMRVLAYPKFHLSPTDQHELLADYLPWTTSVRIPDPRPKVPACRDPADMAFLELATAGHAQRLVSGDRDLLALAGHAKFDIITLAEFLKQLRDNPRP